MFAFLTTILLFMVATVAYAWIYPQITRCYFIHLSSDLEQIEPNVFVDPAMPEDQRRELLENIRLARMRVSDLWGSAIAQPAVIASHNRDVFKRYGNTRGSAGTTHLTPIGSYIVLDSVGLNLDVVSHEFCHAELLERLGWIRREYKIPTWFDEGLAMQLDYRHTFCEQQWVKKTEKGRKAPQLQMISDRGTFWQGSDEQITINYATAKHELNRWYRLVGKKGLIKLLRELNSNESFEETYKRIERDYKKKKRRRS